MGLRFAKARGCHSDEFGVFLQFFNRGGIAVAHPGTQTAEQLVDDLRDRSLVFDQGFHALGDDGVEQGIGSCPGCPVGLGEKGSGAAVDFVAAVVADDDFPRTFFGAGEPTGQHDR